MLSSLDLIDLARHRQGDVSDYRIAKLLGISTAAISGYRTGKSSPANSVAVRLAELAGIDPAHAVVSCNLERASTPEEREVWEVLAARLKIPTFRKLVSQDH